MTILIFKMPESESQRGFVAVPVAAVFEKDFAVVLRDIHVDVGAWGPHH
ncbi:hypothetical protein [Mycolicibacterium smegmatis]|nr:hypothetical protein [Mycolicibacterium smegmatis]MDF1903781.1 hypothetical protein [Mycolicibacterium smegmatis]MDF1910344.1 hypothetical protein [Mycolicibacterium smegmatis]MDF1922105.1 hypothetical protein [Mycolicibacterium smegmatis]MDF1928676.1 hypothetical protein [Mycolicibacterium smegmatis]UAK55241.1 hypothetical protein K8P01_33145 [Mycolicibacterium smegmatis]